METGDTTSQPVPIELSNPEAPNSRSSSPEGSPTPQASGDVAAQPEQPLTSKAEKPESNGFFGRPPITEPEVPKRFEIFNKTPRRIAIKAKQPIGGDGSEYLVISPFRTRVLSEDTKEKFGYESWQREDLIGVKEMDAPTGDLQTMSLSFGCLLLPFLLVALLIALIARLPGMSILIIVVVFLVLVIGLAISFTPDSGKKLGRFWKGLGGTANRLKLSIVQVISLALLLFVVFGLAIGLLYRFSGGQGWMAVKELESFDMKAFGRVIQYLFLTIATLLPALLYFLFDRRKREKMQEGFIREVLRLDPGIRTIPEAEAKYLSQIQETFHAAHTSGFLLTSGLPILVCTLLIFMGWLFVLQPFTDSSSLDITQLENLLLPHASVITFAFLGSYFFAINLVFRRYVRADLTPRAYAHIIKRLFEAIILAWVLSALPIFAEGGTAADTVEPVSQSISVEEKAAPPDLDQSGGEVVGTPTTEPTAAVEPTNSDPGSAEAGGFSTGLLYLLAFFIGIFPETGVTLLQDLAHNRVITKVFPRLEEGHPLTQLDGINLYDRSRFMEEGVENIENLAHHDLIGLMLSTRIPTIRLVDMFDQAILYLHLGLKRDQVVEVRKKLRAYGIRTATDLEAARESAEKRNQDELQKFLKILDDENAQPAPISRIQTILDTLRDDDWMAYLRNWRELIQCSNQAYTLQGVNLVPLEDSVQKAMEMAR